MSTHDNELRRPERPRLRLHTAGIGRAARRVERFDLKMGETAVSAAVLDIVDVGVSYGQNSVWLLTDDGPTETLRFWTAFTGAEIPPEYTDPVGSIGATSRAFVFVEPFWSDDDRWSVV